MMFDKNYPCWSLVRPDNYSGESTSSEKKEKGKVTILSPDTGGPKDYYVETYLEKVRNVYDMEKGEAKVDIPRDIFENTDFKETFIKSLKDINLCIDNLTYLSTVVSVNIVRLRE